MIDLASPEKILLFAIKVLLGIITAGLFVYALIVLREVSIMNSNLRTKLGPLIGIAAFFHFIVAILVVILLALILLTA